MAYFCNGKQGICDHPEHGCVDCKYLDGSGGHKTATITNADHIRGMSDEELAEAFGGSCICSYIQYHDKAFCKERAVCTNCVKDWLQQPYEEDKP